MGHLLVARYWSGSPPELIWRRLVAIPSELVKYSLTVLCTLKGTVSPRYWTILGGRKNEISTFFRTAYSLYIFYVKNLKMIF
jgi:hypothetical protein